MPYHSQASPDRLRGAYNIVCWAEERGITMRELADCTGVPYSYLPRSKRDPLCGRITFRHLDNLCRFFGKQMLEIFS